MTALRGHSKIWDIVIGFKKRIPKSISGGTGALANSLFFCAGYVADWCTLHNKGKHFSRLLTNIMNIFPFGGT